MKHLYLVITLLLAVGATQLSAQKYGHVNSLNIMEEFPGTTTADKELETMTATKQKEIEAKGVALQTKYNDFLQKSQTGTLSPVQLQSMEAELQADQQALQQMEQAAELAILQRRQELLDPIIKAINEAIEAVGKEGNYTMIFDESSGAILYNLKGEDITAQVRAKLGM